MHLKLTVLKDIDTAATISMFTLMVGEDVDNVIAIMGVFSERGGLPAQITLSTPSGGRSRGARARPPASLSSRVGQGLLSGGPSDRCQAPYCSLPDPAGR